VLVSWVAAFGVPGPVADITFAGDVADVAELIGELGLGLVHVYGFSYGGLIGQALALDHPELLRSLIIANSLHSPEMWQANHANINAELARRRGRTAEPGSLQPAVPGRVRPQPARPARPPRCGSDYPLIPAMRATVLRNRRLCREAHRGCLVR
jgi:pimeloyl-ACP methyl ester carboxylesterase